MNHAIIITLCFLPLGLIFIIMKLSLLITSSSSEINYVRQRNKQPHGEWLENVYRDIDEENEED